MVQLTFLGMCRGVEECEGPLAAGRSFALSASPPGLVELHVSGSRGRTWNVPEYLQKLDVSKYNHTFLPLSFLYVYV